jgi:Kef-type K+ transport system membrane component KefB
MTASVQQAEHLLSSVLLQLVVMIAAARLLNVAARRLRQPGAIGEIVAGLMLGPSLFGHFFPDASVFLFGSSSATPITVLSQIGLILLMFQIGADFEFGHLKSRRNTAAVASISVVSIVVPFALGFLIGQVSAPLLAPGIDALTYSLFVGVALAITAVPILGRILREYGLTRTEIGVVTISSAAINDVVGWILLAGISAYAATQFSGARSALQIGGLLALILVLRFALYPLVNLLMKRFPVRNEEIPSNLLAIVLCLVFVLGLATFKLGIFAIFGGFAAGLIFHQHEEFVRAWRRQVGQFVLVFFLPVFFTYTGLRTNVLGLTSAVDLQWLAIILVAAILGKIVPVYIAGRLSGFDHTESSIFGVLMNTRALMELIVLNIGYDLGFIPQNVFTMLVIMAVGTTIMTGPLLKLLLPRLGFTIVAGVEA